jgi:hypothetical protein
MEKSERPLDEQETVGKLLAGLERSARDLSTLVQFGRPIELKKQPGVDLQKVLRSIATTLGQSSGVTGSLSGHVQIAAEPTSIVGEFDPAMLAEALKSISVGALKIRQLREKQANLEIRLQNIGAQAQIEWVGLSLLDHDPFVAFAGSDEIRMSLAAKIINAHGGTSERHQDMLRVRLPITS